MKQNFILASSLVLLIFSAAAPAEVITTETNNGNLVMQDVPPIPAALVASLNRYQNVRSASFLDWTQDGNGIFVSTRFGDVNQVHRVGHAGGARAATPSRRREPGTPGSDLKIRIPLSLEEIAFGAEKKLKVKKGIIKTTPSNK